MDLDKACLFQAAGVFDSYIACTGIENYDFEKILHLAVVSIAMSTERSELVKIIQLLPGEEIMQINEKALMDLIASIPDSFQTTELMENYEKFLKLMVYDSNTTVSNLTF
jgi:hypothetical protein